MTFCAPSFKRQIQNRNGGSCQNKKFCNCRVDIENVYEMIKSPFWLFFYNGTFQGSHRILLYFTTAFFTLLLKLTSFRTNFSVFLGIFPIKLIIPIYFGFARHCFVGEQLKIIKFFSFKTLFCRCKIKWQLEQFLFYFWEAKFSLKWTCK